MSFVFVFFYINYNILRIHSSAHEVLLISVLLEAADLVLF